jgi:hypothetical protein
LPLVLLLALCSAPALAERSRPVELVILLQPTAASPATRRGMARIQDELSADGFKAILVDANFADGLSSVIEDVARAHGSDTMLTMFGDPEAGQTELWVIRRSGRRVAIRRALVPVDEIERMPEVLSGRALELLRAIALELSVAPDAWADVRTSSAEGGAALRHPGSETLSPLGQGSAFAIDVGLAVSYNLPGLPPAIAPLARARLRLSKSLAGRVSASGLGSRPRTQTTNGSAEVSQALGLVEVQTVFRSDRRARPVFSIGAGVLNVGVVGQGKPPYEGRERRQWSAALDVGVGVAFTLRPRIALTTELHAFVATPHPVVRFLDVETATIGYPGLMLLLALEVEP